MKSGIEEQIRESLKSLFHSYIKWVLLVLSGIYIMTGIYFIDRDEAGVLQRFGKVVDGSVKPGLHYALPWPIDTVKKVAVKEVKTLVIDDFSQERWKLNEYDDIYRNENGFNEDYGEADDFYENDNDMDPEQYMQKTGLKPYCISGDNNIVTITILVKYRVFRPVDYLVNLKDSEQIMNDMGSSVIIHSLSSLPVDEILTYGKKKIENDVKLSLQKELDMIQSGIGITFIEIREVNPPLNIQKYFDDVINAKVDKNKITDDAKAYDNQVIPEARAEYKRILEYARAEKQEKIFLAKGQSARFLSQLKEYSKSKHVIKNKLYLDFIQTIYSNLKEIRIVDNNSNEQVLNLNLN